MCLKSLKFKTVVQLCCIFSEFKIAQNSKVLFCDQI